jgi:hypothetical protein
MFDDVMMGDVRESMVVPPSTNRLSAIVTVLPAVEIVPVVNVPTLIPFAVMVLISFMFLRLNKMSLVKDVIEGTLIELVYIAVAKKLLTSHTLRPLIDMVGCKDVMVPETCNMPIAANGIPAKSAPLKEIVVFPGTGAILFTVTR